MKNCADVQLGNNYRHTFEGVHCDNTVSSDDMPTKFRRYGETEDNILADV